MVTTNTNTGSAASVGDEQGRCCGALLVRSWTVKVAPIEWQRLLAQPAEQLMLKRKHPKTTDRIKETGGLDTFLLEVEAVEAVEVESFVIFVQRIP